MAGIITRIIIEPKFINFDEPELVGQSLILLGSLTSLIAGLFIALQLHIYLNNFILESAGRVGLTNFSHYKMKVSRKKDFSSTLEEFWGNFIIFIILLLMFVSYIIESLFPNEDNFLGVFKPPLMKSDDTIIIFLGLFLLFMVLNTLKSFNAWRNRLNFYTYHYFYLENRELLIKEQNADVQEQRTWLNDYKNQFSTNWDRTEELYINRKSELQLIIENVIPFVKAFPEEYEKRTIPENIRKYAKIEANDIKSSSTFDPITKNFWNFWRNQPSQINNIKTNIYKLKIRGLRPFISQTLANKFSDFCNRVNKVSEAHTKTEQRIANLSSEFNYGLVESEKEWLKGINELAFKQILLIEQFPELKEFLHDFFLLRKKERDVYNEKFKPVVQNAKRKFLPTEEDKSLLVVIEEIVITRKEYAEHLENLNKSISKDLEILNKCLDELKPKESNIIIQFFSRL